MYDESSMEDPGLIDALQLAVEASPEVLPLRVHLCEILSKAGRHDEALIQVNEILRRKPDSIAALQIGATSAMEAGQRDLAESYQRMSAALGRDASIVEDGPPVSGFPDEPSERLKLGHLSVGGGSVPTETERPVTTLKDVAGLADVKKRIELAFLGPLRNPEVRKAYGKSLRGGMLLYGPPGCGKTFLARAIAGEMGMQFISVGLEDVLDMYVGESEKQLHEIFENARRIRPCVIFLDEVDAIGRKRSLQRHSSTSTVVNQLLSELDGIKQANDGIFMIAATNHPWDVDSALRRPGRFDRTLFVPPPDEEARKGITEDHLQGRPAEKIDTAKMARMTEGFSGADMAHLVESAAELAMADAVQSGQLIPIRMSHFEQALKDIRPSTRVWLDTAKNYALFANDGGAYDDLAAYLRGRKML
ncbi:MAG TPA: ATP-binding protein [Fimbriimonadaceae bacterium]|nr:ATP-binding protein [Fimbriimonadaceae bacterium]